MKKSTSVIVTAIIAVIIVVGIVEMVDIQAGLKKVQQDVQDKWAQDTIDNAVVIFRSEMEKLQAIIDDAKIRLREEKIQLAIESQKLAALVKQSDEMNFLKQEFAAVTRTAIDSGNSTIKYYGKLYSPDLAMQQLTLYVMQSADLLKEIEYQKGRVADQTTAAAGLENAINDLVDQYRDLDRHFAVLIAKKDVSELNEYAQGIPPILKGTANDSELSDVSKKLQLILQGLEEKIIANDASVQAFSFSNGTSTGDTGVLSYNETLEAREKYNQEEAVRAEVAALLAGDNVSK